MSSERHHFAFYSETGSFPENLRGLAGGQNVATRVPGLNDAAYDGKPCVLPSCSCRWSVEICPIIIVQSLPDTLCFANVKRNFLTLSNAAEAENSHSPPDQQFRHQRNNGQLL